MSEPAVLLSLAESIADGSSIDWNAAEARAGHDERAIIRQLRVLSNLAVLHRSLTVNPEETTPTDAAPSHASPAIGNWAHLALVERLGSGAFGDVFRAWDRRLEREVALKLLRRGESLGPDSDPQTSRIAREGRLLARMRHPNVITVHGVEIHEGRVGLCMELIRGTTIEALLQKRGPFSAREAALLGIDLCHALAAIHGAGLIHRDIKAQNVMREDGGRIVLMDLGTGRETDPERRDGLPDLAGTPLYLAPEIFEGALANEKTDLYSLGVLLYHIVTGGFPVKATSIDELREGQVRGTAVRLRDARPDLPTAFVRVVERAMATDPEQRYASAGALEADLVDALGAPAAPSVVGAPPAKRWTAYWPVAAAAAAVVAIALTVPAVRGWIVPSRPLLTLRDTVLVADFANNTGESIFDGAMKEAFTIQLQQSPYLNALDRSSVEAGLHMMGRAADTTVSGAVARELCQRQGIKAMIVGAISSIGGRYLVDVQAQDCQSGAPLAQGQADAASRDRVLGALGAATAGLREKLGESLASIQQFNVPVEQATTGSLDALKAYSLALETRTKLGDADAVPLFNNALALDPQFALAEARLAATYTNLHEHAQAQLHMKKAFDLSSRVSERERLYIRAGYHSQVTGRVDEAMGAYRLWITMYPMDWVPHLNLASNHYRLGQYEEALKESEETRTLAPDQVFPYEQLAETYLAMGRFADVKQILKVAQSRGIDTAYARATLYQVAFVEGDAAAMRQELEGAGKRSEDYLIVAAASAAAAFNGDLATGRSLTTRAVGMAQSAHMNDYAASVLARDALTAAVVDEADYARRTADRALAISRGRETLWAASLASTLSGRAKLGAQLADEYSRVAPPTPEVTTVLRPVLDAAGALVARQYARALDLLQPAVPYERIGQFWPEYVRGLAYMGLAKPADAAGQFRTILAHRGNQPTSVLFPVARLQLGRALRASGDVPGARDAIGQFVEGWHSADRRQPLVVAALREQARLAR